MFLKGASTANKSFLSRMLQPANRAAFSRLAIQNFIKAEEATQAAEMDRNINTAFHGRDF
jgi:hypothetical protein